MSHSQQVGSVQHPHPQSSSAFGGNPQPVSNEKPSLSGVRIKTRKRVTNAQAKYDPIQFRTELLRHLATVPDQNDLEAITAKLEAAGQTLDYRKYAEPFLQLLFVGRLMAPGGMFIQDSADTSPFCIIDAKGGADKAVMKKYVDVLHKVFRRYKYLLKILEEQSLPHIVQYIHKWTPEQRENLAVATALIITTDLANTSVLANLRKEYLTKEGFSLTFTTTVFRTYLSELPIDKLSANLRKSGIKDISDFFNPEEKEDKQVLEHFKNENLPQIVEMQSKKQSMVSKEEIVSKLREMLNDQEEGEEEIIQYLQAQQIRRDLSDMEILQFIFDSTVRNIDWASRPDAQIESGFVSDIKSVFTLFKPFTEEPRPALALINIIQVYCHDDIRVTKTFLSILKNMYAEDVVPNQAFLYWASKGHASAGKQNFLEATKGLINFIQKQEDEEEEEDDEEEE